MIFMMSCLGKSCLLPTAKLRFGVSVKTRSKQAEALMIIDSNIMNKAIVLFLGYGLTTHPDEQSQLLVNEFDLQVANEIEADIKKLHNEIENLKPDWSVHTLISAGSWLKAETQRIHPELDQLALNAIEWAFTWWWR